MEKNPSFRGLSLAIPSGILKPVPSLVQRPQATPTSFSLIFSLNMVVFLEDVLPVDN